MAHTKNIIPFIFFVFLFFTTAAQDTSKYVYEDSSVKNEETPGNNSIISASPDTSLQLNTLELSPDSVNALKESTSFAYAKNLDSLLKAWQKAHLVKSDLSESKPGLLDKFFDSIITRIILWSLAISFILFILYKLFFTKGFFQKNIITNKVNELAENEAANDSSDYDKLFAQAVNNNDYRLAVRYMYLRSLQRLAENKLVQLAAGKTNYQYINELNNTIYKDDFLWLVLSYEYIWYGEFEPDNKVFAELQTSFNQFNNRLQKN
jgi:hypothetical protein